MTAVHEDRGPVNETRRLAVLPAAVGALAVVWALVGSVAAGVTDGSQGLPLAVGVAALVLATVVSGSGAGLYAGLGLLIVAALTVTDEDMTRTELVALVVAVVVIHETARFSLDARRPARLGPGLVARYLGTTLGVAAGIAAIAALLHRLTTTTPGPSGWIPVGLGAAGVPALALWAGRRLPADRFGVRSRAAAAVAATVVVVTLAVVGAVARSAIEGSGPTPTEADATTTTAVEVVPVVPVELQPVEFRRGLTFLFLIGATLLLGAVYLALRRPEALFQLDDLEHDEGRKAFGLVPPGRAETGSTVEVDDDELARLLAGLRLDIAGQADPGRAVRFGYANVERRLADLDLVHRPAETEREYLARVLAGNRLSEAGGSALAELTALFERARFGNEPVGEPLRARALDAIDRLEAAMAAGPGPGLDRRAGGHSASTDTDNTDNTYDGDRS
ncbi:MAG: DUF4129 domain-containing protein [Actinomycetota bacterium]